jgi:spore coat protein SA
VRDRFIAASCWDSDAIHVVYNGTQTQALRPATHKERAQSRARLGIDDDAVVGVYAGAITPEKGVLHLVHAFNAVVAQIPKACLLIAGGASLWGGIQSVPNEYEEIVVRKASPAIQFLGVVPHASMISVYHAADFAVVPSTWAEPFGMVALDAAAAGLPVIASRTGGLPEIVVDGQTGLLIESKNEEVLGNAIVRLANDLGLRNRLGGAGRRRSLRFSWNLAADNLHKVYDAAREQHAARLHELQGKPE